MESKKEQISITTPNEEVKIFLKIKKVEFSDDKPYYKLNENKQNFTLFDPIRKVDSDKSLIFELDKIFTNEENSYIYEEICRDVVNEAIRGKSFCYIAYGLSHTGRKQVMMGGRDSVTNINSRGLFYRLLDNLITVVNHERLDLNLSLNISYAAIHGSKYIDLSNFLSKKFDDIKEESQLMSNFRDIKKSSDFSSILKKVPVGDVKEVIHFYSQVMSVFYKLEAFEKKINSRTNFIFILNLVNDTGKIISHLTFNLLEGSEKLSIVKANSLVTNNPQGINDVSKIKNSILKENIFDNLLNCISILKNPEYESNKIKDVPFDDSPLTILLKNYLLNPSTKFRILGCIEPNTGYHEGVKDTLMFLFRCKKSVYDKFSIKQNLQSPEFKRDEVLYELENKIKSQEKNILKLNETINSLHKKLDQNEVAYKKNLDIVKAAFAFEGDINKLVLKDDYVKEAKFARSMRDSVEMVKLLNKKIVDLEKKIEDMKEENKKLLLEKRIVENDQMMFSLYSKLKEDNLHEENKIKIMVEHSKELDRLKSENDILNRQIELYRKEVEDKNRFIHNLPSLLKENTEDRKVYAEKSKDIKYEMEKKLKKTLRETQQNFKKEMNVNTLSYEATLKQKNDEIESYKNENASLKNRIDYETKKYSEELLRIHQNLQNLLDNYKKLFDMRRIGNNISSITSFTSFLKSKESFDKICSSTSETIIRYNFPLLYSALDNKKGNSTIKVESSTSNPFLILSNSVPYEVKNNSKNSAIKKPESPQKSLVNLNSNNDLSLSASDISNEEFKLKPKKEYTHEDLEKLERVDLFSVLFDFQRKFLELEKYFEIVKKEKRKLNVKADNNTQGNEQLNSIFKENEKLRRKLDEQVKINYSNKFTIKSQERMLEKIKGQNFLNKQGTSTDTKFNFNTANGNFPKTDSIFSPYNNKAETVSSLLPRNTSTNNFRPQTGRSFSTSKNFINC